MQNDITLLLIAQRKALGLNMTELADLPAISQSKQVIADYESGRRKPARSYIESMQQLGTHYELLNFYLNTDIKLGAAQGYPAILPYFLEFSDFVCDTGNNDPSYWRLWQAAIGQLSLIGAVTSVSDSTAIPMVFKKSWLWLKKDNDMQDLAEGE